MLRINNIIQLLLDLLLFVVIVDPTNTILGLKDIVFFLLIMFLLIDHKNLRLNKNTLFFVVGIYIVFFISLLVGRVTGNTFSNEATFGYLKSFLFLFLFIVVDYRNINFFRAFIPPCVIISIIIIFLWFTMNFWPLLEGRIYNIIMSYDNPTILMGHRNFLSININSVFYKTSPVLIIPFAYYFDIWLNKKGCKNLIFSFLFFLALMGSGTRANMLSAILVLFILYAVKLKHHKYFYVTMLLIILLGSTIIIKKLFKEKEDSLFVKKEIYYNIIDEITSNPLTLLFGNGAGSLYDSGKTAHGVTHISELSYLEIYRMFGLFGGSLIIMLFIFPIYLAQIYKPPNKRAFILGYIAYLFIGGTNPLLIGSTGFTVLIFAYQFSRNNGVGYKNLYEL